MLGFAVQFSSPSGAQSVALIRQAVDNTQRIMLPGHTRPEANAANDVGLTRPASSASVMASVRLSSDQQRTRHLTICT